MKYVLDTNTLSFAMAGEETPRAVWTDEVSEAFGKTKADLERRGTRIEDLDVAVAAHALALDGTLVSDNIAHLSRVSGLRVENWRDRPRNQSASAR